MLRDHHDPKSQLYQLAPLSEPIDSDQPSSTFVEYKRYSIYSPKEWLAEISTSILKLGLLIGITCIFLSMNNKPLSAWSTPGSVSLTATVSIMTTAYTAALMHGVTGFIGQLKWLHFRRGPRKLSHLETYDEASRSSAYGIIMFLTTIKWNLATIGAFITVLNITIGPFAQQVILLKQRDIVTPDNSATFGYAHQYVHKLDWSGKEFSITENIPLDPDMQSAVLQGLYNISTPPIFSCPGVCRWTGSYMSLGFKSECKNVTQATLRSEECDGEPNLSRTCNMTTPGGVNLPTRFVPTDYGTSFSMSARSMLFDHLAFLPEITRFAIYRSTIRSSDLGPDNINITECSLSLTAYENIDAKANGSDFSFGMTREVGFRSNDSWKDSTGSEGMPSMTDVTLYTEGSEADNIPVYKILLDNLLGLGNFFQSDSIVVEVVEGNYERKNLGLSTVLAGDVDLDDRFKKMAARMTDTLRDQPDARRAHGNKVESETYVSIRWLYLIPLVVTELIAIIFAALTIFFSRRSHHVPLWKNSALAMLACQHNKHLGVLWTTSKDIKEIEETANKAKVQLQ
ncbi:hypothetical protein FQN57_003459 [Myotisia sp. PD_48]|nr:hypothetical protein FQN57_003459 [Myotisia sp. PD_48]